MTTHDGDVKAERRKPAVVITGGSRGLGLALGHEFFRRGHSVALIARDADGLNRAIATFEPSADSHAIAIAADVTAPDAPELIMRRLDAAGYYIDILINNAGMGLAGPFMRQSPASIAGLLQLNVSAVAAMTRHVLPEMAARSKGGIINIASLGGYVPGPHQAVYYASKAFVISFSEAIAAEMAGSGVRVSVAAPGPIETDFHSAMGANDALYRIAIPALSPERAARSIYRQFAFGNRVILPGFITPIAAFALKILPHALTVPLVAFLLKISGRQ